MTAPAHSPSPPEARPGELPSVLHGYAPAGFFDEMFQPDGTLRPHYQKFVARFGSIPRPELDAKRQAVDALFLRRASPSTSMATPRAPSASFPSTSCPA